MHRCIVVPFHQGLDQQGQQIHPAFGCFDLPGLTNTSARWSGIQFPQSLTLGFVNHANPSN
ncbi:MAG: hypothetical protein HC768_17865 [Acaryochloris sp. CRU_2_0]|nr:hypothetical protein [Acaryochloris sp. CRU_2_0]